MNYIYQNYHKHSERTNPIISDSTVTYKDYAEAAVKYGHSILSSAEHGYQGRYIETYDTAKDYKLKCLIGAEAYWVRNRLAPDNSNCHIWIGAKNEKRRFLPTIAGILCAGVFVAVEFAVGGKLFEGVNILYFYGVMILGLILLALMENWLIRRQPR